MLLNSSRWPEVPVTTTRPVSSVEPLKWGAFAGLSLNDNQLPTGDLNFGRIMHNRFSQCGCGLYLVAKVEEESSNGTCSLPTTGSHLDSTAKLELSTPTPSVLSSSFVR